jgi:hypothetical protein
LRSPKFGTDPAASLRVERKERASKKTTRFETAREEREAETDLKGPYMALANFAE